MLALSLCASGGQSSTIGKNGGICGLHQPPRTACTSGKGMQLARRGLSRILPPLRSPCQPLHPGKNGTVPLDSRVFLDSRCDATEAEFQRHSFGIPPPQTGLIHWQPCKKFFDAGHGRIFRRLRSTWPARRKMGLPPGTQGDSPIFAWDTTWGFNSSPGNNRDSPQPTQAMPS